MAHLNFRATAVWVLDHPDLVTILAFLALHRPDLLTILAAFLALHRPDLVTILLAFSVRIRPIPIASAASA